MEKEYQCISEIKKPEIILVHEPAEETYLAVKHPQDWGFDPLLEDYPFLFEQWLKNAQKEHRNMIKILRKEGVRVLYIKDLLLQRVENVQRYLQRQTKIVCQRIEFDNIDKKLKKIIKTACDEIIESPIDGLLLGLESSKCFRSLRYELKLKIYKTLKTLMPQTSLFYTQDPVISTPKGLIKPKMSMWLRKQEPFIVELALGRENYVYVLRNVTEGGDVTMYANRMLLGISASSGRKIGFEEKTLQEKAGCQIVRFYVPDFFDQGQRYAAENVMHLDTLFMPLDEVTLLGNKRMLENTAVLEDGKPLLNAYEWGKKNFERIVEVPDDEQQGVYGWGSNVLPLGQQKIITSCHLSKTNKNLRKAGFYLYEIKSTTLTSGFGSFHCMTAYLK